jgi:FkbM family methyltransferase
MEYLVKVDLNYKLFKVLKIILSYINNKIARKNIKKYPQLAIFSFDDIGLIINLEGRYENEILLLIEKLIKDNFLDSKFKTALDIGANIGNHSLFFSQYFSTVYAFEPNPAIYELLKINSTYVSKTKNIIPYCYGLSDKTQNLNLRFDPNNIGDSKIVFENDFRINDKNQITIKVEKADNLSFLKDSNIGLIKIDVEGHEIFTLKGAVEIIRINKPIIIFEQGAEEIFNGTSKSISFLSRIEYEFYTPEKRFDFGQGKVLGFISLIFGLIFGQQLSLVSTKNFKKKYYGAIVAIPKST